MFVLSFENDVQLIDSLFYFSVPTDHNDVHSSNQTFDVLLDRGTRYIVVDCGGGTVDITVHELDNKMGTLKELYKATGGPYGSVGRISIELLNLIYLFLNVSIKVSIKNSKN